MTRICASEKLLVSYHNVGSSEVMVLLSAPVTFSTPPRWLLGAPRVATHRASPTPTAPAGALPTSIVAATALVSGSRRVMVPRASLAAHTPPGLTATALRPSPTRTVATTASLAGSIRETVPSRPLATPDRVGAHGDGS